MVTHTDSLFLVPAGGGVL